MLVVESAEIYKVGNFINSFLNNLGHEFVRDLFEPLKVLKQDYSLCCSNQTLLCDIFCDPVYSIFDILA